jgi:hypothetical protein
MPARALIAAVAALCIPAVASAHGDPAGEILLREDLFSPRGTNIEQLARTVAAAKDAAFPIKVAVIAEPQDLGLEAALFGKPQPYAQELAAELSARVLVVMPNGFGYAVNGLPAPETDRVLAGVAPPDAAAAIRALARAEGKQIVVGASSDSRDRLIIAAGAVAGIALVAGIVLFRRTRHA